MRYIMIDARHRTVFDLAVPIQLDEEFIASELRCESMNRIELTDSLDLWVPDEPKPHGFRFFADGPEYSGDGLICGRTRLDEIKSLPRFFNLSMVSGWITWPMRAAAEMRRPIKLRPAGFPQAGPSDPYHGIAPYGAKDMPYVMQMYA